MVEIGTSEVLRHPARKGPVPGTTLKPSPVIREMEEGRTRRLNGDEKEVDRGGK